MREVQGVIFFGESRFDPCTKPWTSLVRSIVLPDELRRLAERRPPAVRFVRSGRKS
jgi:hypothetical protein